MRFIRERIGVATVVGITIVIVIVVAILYTDTSPKCDGKLGYYPGARYYGLHYTGQYCNIFGVCHRVPGNGGDCADVSEP